MKEIILTFKTKKGTKAYYEIEKEGKARPFMERKISKAIAKESIVCQDPLTVGLKIKVQRLALQIKLDEQIITALAKKGAKKGIDYNIEIKY